MAEKKTVAIIGGGFSGMIAAITLKRLCPSAETILFEALPRVGKKILVTGNGRCNLTNENTGTEFWHGDEKLITSVISGADNKSMLNFFEELGLFCRADFAGRYYPMSNQASSVLDALRSETERLNIRIVTDSRITSLMKCGNRWKIGNTTADCVIFACGGKAASVHGSDGSGLELLRNMGVEITPLYPSLVPLYVGGFTKSLKGIRAQGTITIKDAGRVLASDTGEIQYTDYGISGIPAFQVSGACVRAIGQGREVTAIVDSAPTFSSDELKAIILAQIKKYPAAPAENILSGIMPKKLFGYFLRECSLNPEKSSAAVSAGAVGKIVQAVKAKKYRISGVGSFSEAQVTSGGISAAELDSRSLEIRKLRGVFACGEIIDVDGLCGGYNLQWAYSSAVVAAKGTAKELYGASD